MFQYYIGTLDVTCDMFPCKFAMTMQLPCRHVLAVHAKKGISLYSENGVANRINRWKKTYMQEVFSGKSDVAGAIENESYQVL